MFKRWFSLPLFVVIVIVVLLSLPGIADLFKPGYYTSHDGEGHVIRMDEFYHAFRDGQIPVRWSKRLYFGYGYPFFNFNYPSTYYLGLPSMFLGFSASTAMKTETIVTYILSSVIMFLYLRRKVSWPFAIVGAILYIYAPYRLLNIYVRGSVAESTAFLFPPLLLWTAELIAERKSRAILYAALVISFLGISHNISALLLFGFFFAYLIFLTIGNRSLRPLIGGVVAFGLGLMMAAFFFVPALTEKKYTFLDQTIAKDYPDHFVYISQLLKGGWGFGGSVAGPGDGLSFNVGWMQFGIVVLGSVLIFIWRRLKAVQLFYQDHFLPLLSFTVTILLGSVFFMLPMSRPLWDHLPLLPFVQFPWRFLLLTVPTLAVMSAVILQELAHFFKWTFGVKVILSGLVIAGTLFIAKDEWHINQVLLPKTVSGDALEGSTTWANEQATQWFKPKPNHIPDQKIIFENTFGAYQINSWLTGRHTYQMSPSAAAIVVENTMYYPGWEVQVDGKLVPIDYQDRAYPGRIVYQVSAGPHKIVTRFTETPLRKAMDILSVTTFVGVLIAVGWPRRKKTAKKIFKKSATKKIRST